MPTLGFPELILIVVALILVFGVGKLGDVGSAMGRAIREFRNEVTPESKVERIEDVERETKV